MDGRRILGGIGRTFIASGVLILLFVVYQLWGTNLAESRSQDRLRSDFLDVLADSSTTTTTAPTDGGAPAATAPTTTARPRVLPPGGPVALIRIPKIGVDKAVVEGVSVKALKEGPGHYPTTPMPGQPGNAAIAGHRTTYGAPFFRLDELVVGDRIDVTTTQGEFTYRVRDRVVVRPSQNEVLLPSEENLLTLTTCEPRYSAARRLIVVATLTDEPVEAPPAPVVTPDDPGPGPAPAPSLADDASVSGESTSKTPAILWGLLAAFVWLITWLLSKKWGKVAAYAMGTPVFLVVLFVFFENFARLLPANV